MSVATDRNDAARFYREQLGRDVTFGPHDELVLEREGQRVIAALRLAPEGGTLVLRTMVVADDLRRGGVGTSLLERASRLIGERECFCLAWSYLESFYARAGFARVAPSALPPFLLERLGSATDMVALRRATR